MDFISQLPWSNGYDAILFDVDCFSKMSLFIQTKTTCTSSDLADLFFEHVFSKHGLPENIVSNCGSFTTFQQIIQSLMDRLKESTKYSNNIFKFLSTINRMIGASDSLWQNFPKTMQFIPQLNNPPSKPFTAEILYLNLFTSRPLLLLQVTFPTSSIFKRTFKSILKQPVKATSNKPTIYDSNLLLSALVILSGLMLATFKQQDQLQNFQKESSFLSKSNQLF
ncbi:putative retrotransposon nucleocapsid protein [Puccinia sorghi]|uniref:Putative retrotransposon nucleocapsid protein n=1 Tax=Puccinia sorghi TaxID=27349 RepID=A0A0L6V9C8_9BASI|nr:putative retrotransposon nucleocapsid protein [Puccinia sorghi]